jgi:2-octaprenyl-6-methoxyphenol hydroxylase
MNTQKICIIGDGLSGLSTALILSQKNLKIDLYVGTNKNYKSKSDNRITAISESSFQFIQKRLSIKKNIFWPCEEIKLFFEEKKILKNFLNFKEQNKKTMYFFQNKQLKKKLIGQILKKKKIKIIKKNITGIDYNNGCVLLNKNKMSYDLIILSIGNSSKLYQKITQGRNIEKDYKEIALTTTVKHNSKIDKASQFFLKQGPLAILPFSKNKFSIVWSVNNLFFLKNKNSLKKLLYQKLEDLLKNPKINNIADVQWFPINLSLKTKYFKKNTLIMGDGLHAVHPVAGQGFNLVLRDIKKLSELIDKKLKLGLSLRDSSLLKDFCHARKPENTIVGLGINLTNIFFKDNNFFLPFKKVILNNIKNFKFIKKISQSISDKGISV